MLRILGKLSDVAEGQDGMVTERQAEAAGAGPIELKELLHSGVIEPVVPGVLRLRGGARHPFPRLYAYWLLLAPEQPAWDRPLPSSGVVSHASALRIYGAGNLPGPAAEFSAPEAVTTGVPASVLVHRAELRPDEYREVAGLPVTNPGRTLVDIAAAGSTDLEGLGRIATNFLNQGLATHADLAQALEFHRATLGQHVSGDAQLEILLANVDGAESVRTSRKAE